MAKTINIKTFQKVEKIKGVIEKAYAELEKISNKLYKEHGETEFVIEIEPDEEGNKFMRLKIVNNLRKLEEEGVMYSAASFKKYNLELKRLKREPKK